jgi:myo-inositol catabolism protein IolC
VDWRANKITHEATVAEIARRFREWVDVFEKTRGGLTAFSQRGVQLLSN